jgi:hypothetical protein
VKHHRRRIERVITYLSRDRGQTQPNSAVTLSVISGTSVLAFTKLPGTAVTALAGLVRLFF